MPRWRRSSAAAPISRPRWRPEPGERASCETARGRLADTRSGHARMPTLASFLDRFRRGLLPPGSAGPALPVPADRSAMVEAEVAGLFGDLAAINAEVTAVLDAADGEAARLRSQADEETAAMLATAQERAPLVRSEADQARRMAAQAMVAEIVDAARVEAHRVSERAETAFAAVVDTSVAELRAALLARPR
jgi:hypothetical protein